MMAPMATTVKRPTRRIRFMLRHPERQPGYILILAAEILKNPRYTAPIPPPLLPGVPDGDFYVPRFRAGFPADPARHVRLPRQGGGPCRGEEVRPRCSAPVAALPRHASTRPPGSDRLRLRKEYRFAPRRGR